VRTRSSPCPLGRSGKRLDDPSASALLTPLTVLLSVFGHHVHFLSQPRAFLLAKGRHELPGAPKPRSTVTICAGDVSV
jgi:hypothetical protein